MFKLTSEPTFRHKVRARVPNNGGTQDETFEVTFRVLTLKELEKFDLMTADGIAEFCRAIIVTMHDLADENNQPLDYNDEVRDQVLDLPFARTAITDTYFEAVRGARKGN